MSVEALVDEARFRTREVGALARLKGAIAFRSRRRRAELFFSIFATTEDTRVFDLGGGKGRHFAKHYAAIRNVWIGDYDTSALDFAERHFGYRTVPLDGTETLPLSDGEFDIIFCSSVIEHVTGPKADAVALFKRDGARFRTQAFAYQQRFADEIRRSSKSYFVQTPFRFFPVEVHSWIPLLGFLPTHLQWRIIKVFNCFWPRKDDRPDWSLLTETEMRQLFPDAEIHRETFFGLTKSLIAIRRS